MNRHHDDHLHDDHLHGDHRHGHLPAPEVPVQRRPAELLHPLLELQRQAGNAAVTSMLGVQRHKLDPEEEAGS